MSNKTVEKFFNSVEFDGIKNEEDLAMDECQDSTLAKNPAMNEVMSMTICHQLPSVKQNCNPIEFDGIAAPDSDKYEVLAAMREMSE